MKKYLLGFIATLFLMSCGHIPETHYFTINYPLVSSQNANGHGVIWVRKYDSDPLYSQDKFVYKTSEYEVKFDNYRRWVSTPVELLTLQTVEHLRASGAFANVTLFQPRQDTYLYLSGRIKKFEEVWWGDEHLADVALWINVAKAPEHETVWSGLLEQKVKIDGPSENAILRAMSKAVQNTLNELVEKVHEE